MTEAVKEIMGDFSSPEPVEVAAQNWLKPAAIGFGALALLASAYWLGGNNVSNSSLSQEPIQNAKVIGKPVTRDPQSLRQPEDAMSQGQSLIERLVGNQPWDHNGKVAFKNLFKLWQLEYSPLTQGEPCSFAANYGLNCNTSRGNWQQLREYNRPVVLKFSAGLQGEFWGMLKSLQGTKATIMIGDKVQDFGLGELSTVWTGQYILLWQAPEGYQGDIKLGDSGDAVYWLSQSLNWLNQNDGNPQDVFDQRLKSALISFQSQRDIEADGIAGMQTILKMNAETIVGIPMLTQIN